MLVKNVSAFTKLQILIGFITVSLISFTDTTASEVLLECILGYLLLVYLFIVLCIFDHRKKRTSDFSCSTMHLLLNLVLMLRGSPWRKDLKKQQIHICLSFLKTVCYSFDRCKRTPDCQTAGVRTNTCLCTCMQKNVTPLCAKVRRKTIFDQSRLNLISVLEINHHHHNIWLLIFYMYICIIIVNRKKMHC